MEDVVGEEREDGGRRAESERRAGVESVDEEGKLVRSASRRAMSAEMRERGFEDDMATGLGPGRDDERMGASDEREVSFDMFAHTRHPAQPRTRGKGSLTTTSIGVGRGSKAQASWMFRLSRRWNDRRSRQRPK